MGMNKNYFILIGILFLIPLIQTSFGAENIKAVGITFSKVYESHLKIDNTLHPNFKDLVDLNLDNSNRKISGDFKVIDGIYQRDTGNLMVYHWRFYKYANDYLIFIDPPSDMRDKMKMITIESNLDIYKMPDQMTKQNNTRIVSIDRWIDKGCTEAVIGASNYLKLLADTVYLLRNNCDYSKSIFNHIKVIYDNTTNTKISTSQKWKEDLWKKEIKSSYHTSKIGNDTRINKSVTEDRDPKYTPPKTPAFNYTKYR